MVTIKAGSHTYQLLQLIAIAGEFPASSLYLLGKERVVKELIHRLESVQDIRFSMEGQVYHTKMFTVSGYRDMRTVRLGKGALPLLEGLHPEASTYYLRTTRNHQLSGGVHHVGRNHRVGEAIAMAMMAEFEFRPYELPKLQRGAIARKAFPRPSFYIARDINPSIPSFCLRHSMACAAAKHWDYVGKMSVSKIEPSQSATLLLSMIPSWRRSEPKQIPADAPCRSLPQ